jgi:hypothetical protein
MEKAVGVKMATQSDLPLGAPLMLADRYLADTQAFTRNTD